MAAESFLAEDGLMVWGQRTLMHPVIRVDGKPISSGKPGPVTLKLQAAFQRFIG